MNREHLKAVVWLRWRLMANQWRRAGALNAFLMSAVAVCAVLTAVPLLVGTFALGVYAIPKAAPAHLLYAWDVVIFGFLFFWVVGLVTELQKTEPLSLSKFLHLPVSANGAFLINYLSSLVRLSLIVFGPVMLGFALALVWVKGVGLLPVLPLVAAFLLMVTALTYQFQGWLGALMTNPRRRRTVVVATTAVFVVGSQLPNLVNFYAPRGAPQRANRADALAAEMAKLARAADAHEFDSVELLRRQRDLTKRHQAATRRADRESAERWERAARVANAVVPVGWLPLGVMTSAEGRLWPSLLGLAGMTAIGAVSLRRAYRTTVGQYQGASTNPSVRPKPATAPPAAGRKPTGLLVEARIPGLSEPVSAIALGGFRSLVRSPEVKMMLLTPVIMSAIFGSMLWKGSGTISVLARPLVAIGAMGVVLLGLLQLGGNQFGFDRDGFRVFVLCSAPRRDILLGKNLSLAPLALGLAAILLVGVQVVCPLRWDHFLAMIPQFVSMFLMACVFTNLLSIYAPMHVAAGSMKGSNLKFTTGLLQVVMFVFLFPLTQGVTLLPLGIEVMLELLGWTAGLPIYLLLSLIECAAVVVFYRVSLGWLGDLFQAREQKILEVVTNRAA